jgi:hypothetical protein
MPRAVRLLLVLASALLVLAGGVWVFTENYLPPMPEARAALISDGVVAVETQPWLVFEPAEGAPTTGFIFYPGGLTQPESYAPAARLIAAQGYQAVIVPMPLNLAVLASGRAGEVIAAYPQITRWAIGGHSLGGAMAASYARQHPNQIQGLVLWASYPSEQDDLSALTLEVVSVYGSNDSLSTEGTVRGAAPRLPPETRWVLIEGGNHGQYGWYGDQPGDQPAGISRQQQQAQAIEATLAVLTAISQP